MKWRKALLMILVFGAAVVGNGMDVFASSDRLPTSIEVHYEGNNKNDSYNYYRVGVKFTAAQAEGKRVFPSKLEIYQKYTPSPQALAEGHGPEAEKLVHTATFSDAGIAFRDAANKNKIFLSLSDSFHYRMFSPKNKPHGTYDYRAVLTWNPGETMEATNQVKVTKNISTQKVMIGTANVFSRGADNPNITLETKFFPKAYGPYATNVNNGHVRTGYNAADNTIQEENNLDREWNNTNNTLNVSPAAYATKVFVNNASLETHVLYTGIPLASNKEVKFYIYNNNTFDNSLEVTNKREVPLMSKYLTELARKSQNPNEWDAELLKPEELVQALSYPNGVYNKRHIEVYMGSGSGTQNDMVEGVDNENDVAAIFSASNGTIHDHFEVRIEDENGNHVPGFVFDYFNITYNPFILGEPDRGGGDGYVKPSGYVVLNSDFKVVAPITKPEITIDLDGILGNSDLTNMIDFNRNGIKLYFNNVEVPLPGVLPNNNKVVMDITKIPSVFLEETVPLPGTSNPAFKNGNYKIKMLIPTKLKQNDYTDAAYEGLIAAADKPEGDPLRKEFPIKLQIIQDENIFEGRDDLKLRVDKTYKIIPYRMPGIN